LCSSETLDLPEKTREFLPQDVTMHTETTDLPGRL
jgi:hypothetical protein